MLRTCYPRSGRRPPTDGQLLRNMSFKKECHQCSVKKICDYLCLKNNSEFRIPNSEFKKLLRFIQFRILDYYC
ncbi:MAG: hypothetical protein LBB88_10465 [Planctomycetaceae bacterium]|nr:hypothetical protein [Planctomycetaceae bacterium]